MTGDAEVVAAYGGCRECTCCFGLRVEVTAFDVLRLVDSLGVAALALVEPEPESVGAETSFYLDTSGRAFVLVLGRLPAPHRCALLVGPLGEDEYRCGVYANRPLVCRSFPYELAGGLAELRTTAPCPAGSWATTPDVAAERREVLRRHSAETDAQRWMVRRWNTHVLGADALRPFTFVEHLRWLEALARRATRDLDALTADARCTEAWGRRLDAGASPLDPRTLGLRARGDDAALAPWWDRLQRLAALFADAPPPAL